MYAHEPDMDLDRHVASCAPSFGCLLSARQGTYGVVPLSSLATRQPTQAEQLAGSKQISDRAQLEEAMDEKVPAPLLVKSSMDKNNKKTEPYPLQWVEKLFKWAWIPLPGRKKKKNKSAGFPLLLLSVQGVLVWALAAAFIVAVTVGITAAIVFANIPIPCNCDQNARMFQCPDLTPAQDVEVVSFMEAFLWFTVSQATVAVVGFLLPHRRTWSRWSLAFLALASAAGAQYMQTRSVLIFFAANPGDIGYRVMAGGGAIFFILGDVLSLLSLLIGGPDE